MKIVSTFFPLPVSFYVRLMLLLTASLAVPLRSWGILPATVEQQLKWELGSNSFHTDAKRQKGAHFPLYHYDVPLSLLAKESYLLKVPESIKSSLIYEKNGVPTLRWIINPEDTKYHLQLKKFLVGQGLDATPKTYFKGHLTASRSLYIEAPNPKNPDRPLVFSGKVSTNRTGGKWKKDKGVDKAQVEDSMIATKLAQSALANGNVKFSHLKLLEEPAAFLLEGKSGGGWMKSGLEQGFIIRDIGLMSDGEHYYLPGFSALHEKTGKELAALNGSRNPQEFWLKNYIRPLGQAAAEFSAYLGLSMTSAHNQQWLIELDKNKKPTGKIVLRDFNDSHVFRPFYENSQQPIDQEVLKIWGKDKKYNRDHLLLQLGIFHATKVPSWINKKDVPQLEMEFFKAFDETYSKITGIPLSELERKKPTILPPPRYSLKSYKASSKGGWSRAWRRYFAAGPCFRGADEILWKGRRQDCKSVLQELASIEPEFNASDRQDGSCDNNENGSTLETLKNWAAGWFN